MTASEDFDPYRKWLGIQTKGRSPNFYELLAINLDEDDREVIEAAYEQRSQFVESKRGEGHEAEVNSLLMQLQEAKITLLDSAMRRDYDRRLKLFNKRRKNRQVDPLVTTTRADSVSGRTVGEVSGIVRLFAGLFAVLAIGMGVMYWFANQVSEPIGNPVVVDAPPQQPTHPINDAPSVTHPEQSPIVDVEEDQQAGEPSRSTTPVDFNWKFSGILSEDIDPQTAFSVEEDGSLTCIAGDGGWCLVSEQEAQEFVFFISFKYDAIENSRRPFVSIASTLPNPSANTRSEKLPRGIEVLLNPAQLGDIRLPSEDFKVQLQPGQNRNGRNVPRSEKAPLNSGWNRVAINCHNDGEITVRVNGKIVNTLSKVESTKGHLLIFPQGRAFEFSNAGINFGRIPTGQRLAADEIQDIPFDSLLKE